MTTLLPYSAEDLLYPAYQDRLLLRSICQAGVTTSEDLKVLPSSGLQVAVQSGSAYVKQTNATEESSSTFFNGLYFVPISAAAQPYNTVEVSSVNPQLAQIILRVYDVNELKISGSSFARLEWLNGTPTSGATLANRNGHATLPTSSLLLSDVLVPKNTTKSSEFEIKDRRTSSAPVSSASINTNSGQITRALNTELEVNNLRPAIVTITAQLAESTGIQFVVNEVTVVAEVENKNSSEIKCGTSFPVPAGQKWKGTKIGTNAITLSASYCVL